MTVVRWTDQAVEDLRSIREFIERDSPRYGRLVAKRLFEATSRIEIFPYSGRAVPELGREDVRAGRGRSVDGLPFLTTVSVRVL